MREKHPPESLGDRCCGCSSCYLGRRLFVSVPQGTCCSHSSLYARDLTDTDRLTLDKLLAEINARDISTIL